MSDFQMRLDTTYFEDIKNGKKIYEVRIYDDKRRKIRLLDRVTFVDRGDTSSEVRSFEAEITELSFFLDFYDAIQEVGVKKVLPRASYPQGPKVVRSLEEAVKIYNSFNDGGYERDAKKYGVLRMRFELI